MKVETLQLLLLAEDQVVSADHKEVTVNLEYNKLKKLLKLYFFLRINMQSNLCITTILGTLKKWPLIRGWPFFRVWSKILVKVVVGFSRAGDSGRSLLTGGRCSEVALSTDLIVQYLQNM